MPTTRRQTKAAAAADPAPVPAPVTGKRKGKKKPEPPAKVPTPAPTPVPGAAAAAAEPTEIPKEDVLEVLLDRIRPHIPEGKTEEDARAVLDEILSRPETNLEELLVLEEIQDIVLGEALAALAPPESPVPSPGSGAAAAAAAASVPPTPAAVPPTPAAAPTIADLQAAAAKGSAAAAAKLAELDTGATPLPSPALSIRAPVEALQPVAPLDAPAETAASAVKETASLPAEGFYESSLSMESPPPTPMGDVSPTPPKYAVFMLTSAILGKVTEDIRSVVGSCLPADFNFNTLADKGLIAVFAPTIFAHMSLTKLWGKPVLRVTLKTLCFAPTVEEEARPLVLRDALVTVFNALTPGHPLHSVVFVAETPGANGKTLESTGFAVASKVKIVPNPLLPSQTTEEAPLMRVGRDTLTYTNAIFTPGTGVVYEGRPDLMSAPRQVPAKDVTWFVEVKGGKRVLEDPPMAIPHTALLATGSAPVWVDPMTFDNLETTTPLVIPEKRGGRRTYRKKQRKGKRRATSHRSS